MAGGDNPPGQVPFRNDTGTISIGWFQKQGANLGIADAFALADIIGAARKADRQWAALHTLSKYQRQRKGANQLMEMSMTAFKELFGQKNALLSEVRNAGLSLVDHIPALKYRIIKQALGV